MIDGFTPLIGWAYTQLSDMAPDVLRSLKQILAVHEPRASTLGITPRLLAHLQTRLPPATYQQLALPAEFTATHLDTFTRQIDLEHHVLVGRSILCETPPDEHYESLVVAFMTEALAHREHCLLITRRGQTLYTLAKTLPAQHWVHTFCLSPHVSTQISRDPRETQLPLYDITQILDAIQQHMAQRWRTALVLDDLSDLVLSLGFNRAYRLLRHATELVATRDSTALCLLNRTAHPATERSALEGLFPHLLHVTEGTLKRIK